MEYLRRIPSTQLVPIRIPQMLFHLTPSTTTPDIKPPEIKDQPPITHLVLHLHIILLRVDHPEDDLKGSE